jgi:hypothetical protein
MHHFQDKVPIHPCPVDILQLNSWTWRAIDPTDMSTDKALDVRAVPVSLRDMWSFLSLQCLQTPPVTWRQR